jgi:hypothetical protein
MRVFLSLIFGLTTAAGILSRPLRRRFRPVGRAGKHRDLGG